MLFTSKTLFLLAKEDETGASSAQEDDDYIDKLAEEILDGEDKADKENEVPKKDPEFTKQFAKRLKEERDKVAKQLGFESFDEAMKGNTRKTISEAGYDPDDPDFKKAVEAAVKEKLETDPELVAQKTALAELKAKEAMEWEKTQLASLESEYGVKLKSLSDVDAKVKELMAKGLDLTDAYYIVNKSKLKTKASNQTGKDHLNPDVNSSSKGASDGKIVVTQSDIERFREFSNGNETDDEIRARLEKLRGQTNKK